jgi:hypothetical protein
MTLGTAETANISMPARAQLLIVQLNSKTFKSSFRI